MLPNLLQSGLKRLGVQLIRTKTLGELRDAVEVSARHLAVLRAFAPEARVADLLPVSVAQLQQDLFALVATGFRRDGFFVEFGAADGAEFSNSLLLERDFGWTGILAEPARVWHEALRKHRKGPIETDVVWSVTGDVLEFTEARYPALSTIGKYADSGRHAEDRRNGAKYSVKTISLMDLLAKYGAPADIDFLSIDTEGSEFDILNAFDFGRYRFSAIACEHNYTPNRERIFGLLTSHGYRRVLEQISGVDDWYVQADNRSIP